MKLEVGKSVYYQAYASCPWRFGKIEELLPESDEVLIRNEHDKRIVHRVWTGQVSTADSVRFLR